MILAGAVAIGGFWLARQRYLAHDSIGEVAVVGLLACLLSPVAWIHHHHWVVVVIFALLGAQPAQHRARAGWAAIVAAFYTVAIPWWGNAWLTHPDWPAWFGEPDAELHGGAGSRGSLHSLGGLTNPRRVARSR